MLAVTGGKGGLHQTSRGWRMRNAQLVRWLHTIAMGIDADPIGFNQLHDDRPAVL